MGQVNTIAAGQIALGQNVAVTDQLSGVFSEKFREYQQQEAVGGGVILPLAVLPSEPLALSVNKRLQSDADRELSVKSRRLQKQSTLQLSNTRQDFLLGLRQQQGIQSTAERINVIGLKVGINKQMPVLGAVGEVKAGLVNSSEGAKSLAAAKADAANTVEAKADAANTVEVKADAANTVEVKAGAANTVEVKAGFASMGVVAGAANVSSHVAARRDIAAGVGTTALAGGVEQLQVIASSETQQISAVEHLTVATELQEYGSKNTAEQEDTAVVQGRFQALPEKMEGVIRQAQTETTMKSPMETDVSSQAMPEMAANESLPDGQMHYRFSQWGNEHSVRIQSQLVDGQMQLELDPSTAFVEQQLDMHWEQDKAEHWTMLRDSDQQQERRPDQQPDKDEE